MVLMVAGRVVCLSRGIRARLVAARSVPVGYFRPVPVPLQGAPQRYKKVAGKRRESVLLFAPEGFVPASGGPGGFYASCCISIRCA